MIITCCNCNTQMTEELNTVSAFFDWHHRLTGSCNMGRQEFAKEHNIDIENGEMTVAEFIKLTRDSYGGEVIRTLERWLNHE